MAHVGLELKEPSFFLSCVEGWVDKPVRVGRGGGGGCIAAIERQCV